ncbi:CpaD family pilus assembly lipoprotein [uncultured Cedecea sp.]|uniref:CpaD family pilus assembly lipoprotein n=1 Tax=uncultured Cedecea sp. TaxID=988762 RepID=UPI002635E00D|nr:CpaD family pilus assembly lipoprotein [uncultured Cedecea sp.]
MNSILRVNKKFAAPLAGGLMAIILSGCTDRALNDIRMQRYDQPALAPVTAKPSALAVNLQAASKGQGLSPASLSSLNELLVKQGRLTAQTLIITPYTVRGEQLAGRLAKALQNAGADPKKIKTERRIVAGSGQGDLQVISQAIAVQTTRCQINDPGLLMVKPYDSVGYLGCATQNNLAMMIAEPKDLIQARMLDGADGVAAVNAIERYQTDNVKTLINIDFSED